MAGSYNPTRQSPIRLVGRQVGDAKATEAVVRTSTSAMGGHRCEPRLVASDLGQFEIVRIKAPSGSVSLRGNCDLSRDGNYRPN